MENMLKTQLVIYLAQEYGIDLGYEFAFARRRPYSRLVASQMEMIKSVGLKNLILKHCSGKNQKEFLEKIRPYEDDEKWLEMASTIIYLYNDACKGKKLKDVQDYLMDDICYIYGNFNTYFISTVISDIIRLDLIKNKTESNLLLL